ncbi:MAG: PAS domain-containing sensor histidine kinase [Desulfopila sp.]|jgi:PAS domain S-box-containing protein|nr:PAS domain-containing sensor histidine kinase [Desulfopila sp.]
MSVSDFSIGKELELHRLELVQFALDNAADAIFWIDEVGRFIYVNHAATESLGYTKKEMLSMHIQQIDRNFQVDLWQSHWNRVKKHKKLTLESSHLTKSGESIPVEVKCNHLTVGKAQFHCAFSRNITHRKKVEKVLLESERQLRKTLEATSDGVWMRNLQTGEVYYGAKWATVLGYSKEDLRTGKITWENLLHPDDRCKTVQALRDHLNGKTPAYEAEFRLRNSSNQWQWIHARGRVIEYTPTGKPLRFVGTHTDITSRKMMEDSLLKSTEEIKLFAYSVAHDLKSPALAVRGLAERFRAKLFDLSDTKKLEYCDRIIESAEQLVDLVDKINTFISSKETTPVFEEVPLREVVHASREEFAAQLQYRSIAWREFPENPVIKMDRGGIIRVLRNLVENSLKYGGPRLSKITISYQNTAGYHVISVRDNGVGMNVDDSERIFQPFKRKNSSSEQSGSGLGLAIVKEIAHRHKGEVWLEPNTKRGVQFCFAISKKL